MKETLERHQNRFWSKVKKTSGCWEWQGCIHSDSRPGHGGYGYFDCGDKKIRAHRAAYILEHGDISRGEIILHKCDNRKCVNPAHLVSGTEAANMQDASIKGKMGSHNGNKTHCRNGHEYTPENTYVYKNGRSCKACTIGRTRKKRGDNREYTPNDTISKLVYDKLRVEHSRSELERLNLQADYTKLKGILNRLWLIAYPDKDFDFTGNAIEEATQMLEYFQHNNRT